MSAHVSQAFSIAHCTDLEDLPCFIGIICRNNLSADTQLFMIVVLFFTHYILYGTI